MINDDMLKIYFIHVLKLCVITLIWFQTKLLYQVLGTRSYLYKLHLGYSDKCIYCGEIETIVHICGLQDS